MAPVPGAIIYTLNVELRLFNVICFPLAPNNIFIFLFTEFAFLFGL